MVFILRTLHYLQHVATLLVVAMITSGCATRYINRGTQLVDIQPSMIEADKDDVLVLIDKVGVPTAISSVLCTDGMFRYYYVASLFSKTGPLTESLRDAKVLIVTVDLDGIVRKVEEVQMNNVAPSNKSTTLMGKYKFTEQLSNSSLSVGSGSGPAIKLK